MDIGYWILADYLEASVHVEQASALANIERLGHGDFLRWGAGVLLVAYAGSQKDAVGRWQWIRSLFLFLPGYIHLLESRMG